MMNARSRFRSLCVAAAIAALAGCAAPTKQTAEEGKPLVVPPDIAAKYGSPLGASQLREQALTSLGTAAATDPNAQFRANALEAMSVAPNRLAPYLPAALRDENPGVRSTAAMLIGKTDQRDLVSAVRPLMDDPNPFAKASAIFALNKCGQKVDATPLAELLLSDPSPRVRSHAAYLLGEMGDPTALGLLREASRSPVPRAAPAEVRLMQLQIAEAIVKLGDETQLETIRAALYPSRPEDLEVTALAVQIIGELRDKQAMDELIYLSAKRDKKGNYWPAEIRLGVAGAMARLGKTQGTFLADEYAGNPLSVIRAQAAFVYGQIGKPENLPKLAVLMGDQSGIVQVSAAAAVLRITGTPEPGAPQVTEAR